MDDSKIIIWWEKHLTKLKYKNLGVFRVINASYHLYKMPIIVDTVKQWFPSRLLQITSNL